MKQYGKLLILTSMTGFMVLGMVNLSGCSHKKMTVRMKMGQLSDFKLDQVLRRNIEAIGGLDLWGEPLAVSAKVVASINNPDGGKSLIEQDHEIISDEQVSISVISDEAQGLLYETLDRNDRMTIRMKSGESEEPIEDVVRVQGGAMKLYLEAIAVTGGIGILKDDLALRYRGLERKGGRYHHKLEATGRLYDRGEVDYKTVDDMLVVWIDAETNLIDRIWVKYQRTDKPDEFGYLAVNVRNYTETENGLKLPKYIAFVPSDANQQFSRSHILILEVRKFTH